MTDLESQLANIFKKGLEADPKTASSLASALSSHVADSQDGPYTKAEANYHTATDTSRECGDCLHMTGSDSCELVSGHISADGTCDHWAGSGKDGGDGGSASDSSGADSAIQPVAADS